MVRQEVVGTQTSVSQPCGELRAVHMHMHRFRQPMCDTKVGLYSRQCLCDSSHKMCVWCEIAFWLWSLTHEQIISRTFLLDQKKMLQFEVILIEFNQRWKGIFRASRVWNETHVLKTTTKQTSKPLLAFELFGCEMTSKLFLGVWEGFRATAGAHVPLGIYNSVSWPCTWTDPLRGGYEVRREIKKHIKNCDFWHGL